MAEHFFNPFAYHFLLPSKCNEVPLNFQTPIPVAHSSLQPILITSYNVLRMEIHLFHLNVTHNVQPLREYNIFIATIYLIGLFCIINLKTLRNMEGHFTNFTFASAGALGFV